MCFHLSLSLPGVLRSSYLSPGLWSSGAGRWGWTPPGPSAPSRYAGRASPPRCCSPGTAPASPGRRSYSGAGLWGCSPAPSCYSCCIAVKRRGGKRNIDLLIYLKRGRCVHIFSIDPNCVLFTFVIFLTPFILRPYSQGAHTHTI